MPESVQAEPRVSQSESTQIEPTLPVEPSCGNCPHYRQPKPTAAAWPTQSVGACQRYPAAERKLHNEICGEHPRLALLRDQQLAGLIAAQLEQIFAPPPVDTRATSAAPTKTRWRS